MFPARKTIFVALILSALSLCSDGVCEAQVAPASNVPQGLNEAPIVSNKTFATEPTDSQPTGGLLAPMPTMPTKGDTASSDTTPQSDELSDLFADQAADLTRPESLPSSIKLAVVLGVLSLAPAILLMTTCYVRIIVVLTLLRQAFGVQQMPPTQVLTALSLFVTLLVMTPVWQEVKTEAIDPYTRAENPIEWEEAWDKGVAPVKRFMLKQIRIAKNEDSIAVIYRSMPQESAGSVNVLPETMEEVPVNIVLPAFLISELKVAFLLGFQIYLPFLILDLVVSSVTVSMGMVMLPPTMVSFPLKLILFVMVDGWNLVLGMLMKSFGPFM